MLVAIIVQVSSHKLNLRPDSLSEESVSTQLVKELNEWNLKRVVFLCNFSEIIGKQTSESFLFFFMFAVYRSLSD